MLDELVLCPLMFCGGRLGARRGRMKAILQIIVQKYVSYKNIWIVSYDEFFYLSVLRLLVL